MDRVAWFAERSAATTFGRRVTDILDGRPARCCTPPDIARLKEFNAWADAHPAKAELYGYLSALRDL